MPSLFPGAPIPWLPQQFCDPDGHPYVGGKLYSYVAGTSTPLPLYTDSDLSVPATNPVILNSAGMPDDVLYDLPQGYKYVLKDADNVEIWTKDNIENVGATFASRFGLVLASGGKNVTSGYVVLESDRLVTVDSAGGPDPCVITLLAAADATQPVCIKNFGDIELAVTPDGTDTIDAVLGAFTVPVAANPVAPSIWLVPDGVSAWYVIASHGL